MSERRVAPLLELRNISKRFGVTQALKDVSLSISPGGILGIAGLNGSGKSTLLRVIGGVVLPDEGTIHLEGSEVQFRSPHDSIQSGIALVHQELSLAASLSVLENIFLGHEPTRLLMVDSQRMTARAKEILDELGVTIELQQKVRDLLIADQQLVEIAKALSVESRLICLDEPTSALSETEVERLFTVLRSLASAGRAIIFVSHNVNELAQLCDRALVLVGGSVQTDFNGRKPTPEGIADALFGMKARSSQSRPSARTQTDTALRVSNLASRVMRDVTLSIQKGEVVGLFGLLGSGIDEFPAALYGLRKYTGEVEVQGRVARLNSPPQARRAGIAYIPPDRRTQGLFVAKSAMFNTSFLTLDDISRAFVISSSKEKEVVKRSLEEMRVVFSHLEQRLVNMSGGNQQKVLVGKWLTIDPKVILAHEPFRGIDIVTKNSLKTKFREIAQEGVGVMLISNELEEIMDGCDRILVMKDGAIVAEYQPEAYDPAKILLAAS